MAFTRTDVLATAERSPAAAGAHDKDGWVGLFTSTGGSRIRSGRNPTAGVGRSRCSTTRSSAHATSRYRADADIVTGSTVVRDGELEIAMGPITLRVPVYIRYDLKEDGGDLKIAALSAFWELPAMVGQFLRGGIGGLPAGLATVERACSPTRASSASWDTSAACAEPGRRASGGFREFLDDARAGNEVAVRRWLGKGARVTSGDDLP